MSGSALRPARRPVVLRPSPGDAAIGSPWFGPPRLTFGDPKHLGRPWILTFVGTDESFVDAFFRGIERSGGGYQGGAFPKILPVRDYAEPPRALIDGGGAPMYARAHVEPAAWPEGGEAELDGKASFEKVLEEIDPDALPPASEPDHPAWLRKLYLPMHVHFHVVACDLLCARPGLPRIDPKRVIEAGMVVRRLVAVRESQPKWEDWIPSPLGNGIWAEIAGEDMKIPGTTRALDPKDIPADVELRYRLGLDKSSTEKLSLATIPLAPVPAGVGEGKKHTARWGFLPVSSPDKQRELPPLGQNAQEIAKALADRAEAYLDERIFLRAQEIQARIHGALTPLVEMFRDALPNRPTIGEVSSAYDEIINVLPFPQRQPSPEEIDVVLNKPAMVALALYADRKLVESPFSTWMLMFNASPARGMLQSSQEPWVGAAVNNAFGALSTVMGEIVSRAINGALSEVPPQGGVDRCLLVALLLWVRRYRSNLLDRFDKVVFTPPSQVPPPDAVPTNDPVLGKKSLPMPTGPLGAELQSLIAANDGRDEEPVSWPLVSISETEKQIHNKATALERVLSDIDAQGAGAGSGYDAALHAMATKAADDLFTLLGAPVMRERGIDVLVQPDRGLLVFPGPGRVDQSPAAVLKDAVMGYYTGGASTKITTEAAALQQVVRPRYDADSLYAVWCYARVASKDHCEEPQIVWSLRTDVFSIAEPMDLLGLKPVAMRLPDLPKLIRSIPRMKKARALPFAAVTTPQDSGIKTGDDPKDTAREFGIAWVCSFGIPVFTICAWVMFSIIFSILLLIPGFAWMLLLKFCIPVPTSKKS